MRIIKRNMAMTDSHPAKRKPAKPAQQMQAKPDASKNTPIKTAVKKNPGNFANNPDRAREAGRKGGQKSGGNFRNNPKRASEAGRKGGKS